MSKADPSIFNALNFIYFQTKNPAIDYFYSRVEKGGSTTSAGDFLTNLAKEGGVGFLLAILAPIRK